MCSRQGFRSSRWRSGTRILLNIRAVVSISLGAKESHRLMMRPEASGDAVAMQHVTLLAFDRPQEADLVNALRRHGGLTISLVALQGGRNAGHMGLWLPSWLGKEMISLSPPPRRTVRTSHLVHGSRNLRTPRGELLH